MTEFEGIGSAVVRMDAAGEELSAELQQLLQLLEGKIESWSEAGKSLGRIDVRDEGKHTRIISKLFHTADSSYESFKEWRVLLGAQAKLRLMQAIGSCTTLRNIDVEDLTGDELEALLTPLQSNPVLDTIFIRPPSASGPTEVVDAYIERISEILGRILQTSSTFSDLSLELWRLTAAGAYHLASGLRGNDKSALNLLSLSFGGSTERSAVKQIAEMVRSAPTLSELRLWGVGDVDDDGIDTMANALAQSTSLKSLLLYDVGSGASAMLLKALTGEGSNNSITSLRVHAVMEGIGDCLPLLLSSNQSLKDLEWVDQTAEGLSPKQWRSLGQSLSSNSSLDLVRILIPCSSPSGGAIDDVEHLFSAGEMNKACVGLYLNSDGYASSSPWNLTSEWRDAEAEELLPEVMKKPIIELHLVFLQGSSSDSTTVWANLAKALSSKVNAFSSLYLQMGPPLLGAKGRELRNFFHALLNSSNMRLLTVEGGTGEYWPGGWKELVDCLHVNTSITHLRLINCNGLDENVFKQFMAVLQVNLTLKRVRLTGTSWETDGKKALIEQALRRNAEQDSYFSVFRRHGLPFHPAKNGRLFLCGSPFAGKTRLRHTMTSFLRGASWLGDKVAELRSTEGIEVELLKNDQEMQIAIWDLAGQWIFRTLQDILFPRRNHTSIFLFVFSPYDRKNCCIKENLDHCFKSELEEWLRFIASNTQVTGQMLPKVLVVMSHMDKMKYPDASWAQSILMELREEFETILDIHSEKVYLVDARRKGQVALLKDSIFYMFRELLKAKTLLAPRACSQISSELAKRTKNIKYRPVWSSEEFYSFCYKSLQGDVNESLKPETTSGLEVFEAIAYYLHDAGSVIIIRSLDRIIVDPNWLTNTFLGELITMGHNFQGEHSAVQKSKLAPFSNKSGFVTSSELQFLLSSSIEKHPESRNVDKSLLEELLIHFDLCYKLDDGGSVNARYYIPAIVCEDACFTGLDNRNKTIPGIECLEWSSPPERGQEFIGFRVQCDNPRRMLMTAALYPRFQIHIRHKLMKEMNLTEGDVMCSRNCMHLRMDGHEVFVERSDMTKSHIDVMVKCSKYTSRETAMRYIQEHIVDELHTFCASPKGCPGVALAVGVLQTRCVEELVPLEYRGDTQAILIEKLKEKFQNYILKRLEETTPESWSESNSSILTYEHSWPPIPQYLPSSSELAKKLLLESEVESVTKKVVEKYEQKLKQVDQISEEMDTEMNQGQDQTALKMAMVTEVGTSTIAPVVRDPSSSSANTTTRSDTSQPTIKTLLSGTSPLQDKVDEGSYGLEQKVDERSDSLEATLGQIDRNMNHIITLQLQLQSSLSTFMSKVDRMTGYAEFRERYRTPKHPFLSFNNISIFHKVTARIRLGTPVRLHLMCESIAGPHIVKDQPGLDLCLEKENMEWLRCIYHVSSRMLYYLGKAALHETLGEGEAVSERDRLRAALPVSVPSVVVEDIKVDNNMVSLERSGNMTITEAWRSLAAHLKDKHTELFKFYRVKYLNMEERDNAWLCDQCMARGIRNRSLECL